MASIKTTIGDCTFELKEIYVSETRSDETTCFDAIAYINGRYLGQTWNDGQGGPTFLPVPEHMEPEVELLESRLAGKSIRVSHAGREMSLNVDLEFLTDLMVHASYYENKRKFVLKESVNA